MIRDIIDNINSDRSACVMDVDLKEYNINRISPILVRVEALEKGGSPGVTGKDGRELELKTGFDPLSKKGAVLWRYKTPKEEPEDTWKLLVLEEEIQGPSGPPGVDGKQGEPGSLGSQGEKGEPGEKGDTGPRGLQGEIGPQGEISPPGDKGEPGEKGDMGEKGDNGHDGKSIALKGHVTWNNDLTKIKATIGDYFLVTKTGHMWTPHTLPSTYIANWTDCGLIQGPIGPRGYAGPTGPKGEEGGIATVVVDTIIATAVSSAVSAATAAAVSEATNIANDIGMKIEDEIEDTAKSMIEKTIDEAMEDLKGDKGEDGKDGKDGKSMQMVGSYDTLAAFLVQYPAVSNNVGKAALIGDASDPTKPRELWCITESMLGAVKPEDMGDIRGPKGENAKWKISVRDKAFVESFTIKLPSDVDPSVSSMYLQETDSILIKGLTGASIKGVGYRMEMKYPIPTLFEKDDISGSPSTKDKVLSNNGKTLSWVEQTGGGASKDYILLRSPNRTVWGITVDDTGRIDVLQSIESTDINTIKLKSPNGKFFGISVNNSGRINIVEVL